jgi:hypothetical protein
MVRNEMERLFLRALDLAQLIIIYRSERVEPSQ